MRKATLAALLFAILLVGPAMSGVPGTLVDAQERAPAAQSASGVLPALADLSMQQKQLLKLGGWLLLGTLILLVILGITNRVVIFYDTADAWWSISPFLFVTAGIAIAVSLTPDGRAFATTPIEKAVLAGGGAGAILGVVMAFYNSIRYNQSVFLGLLVGTCKVIISVLMALTFIGSFRGVFDSRHTNREAALFALIGMAVGFLWFALVNGERVERHRYGASVKRGRPPEDDQSEEEPAAEDLYTALALAHKSGKSLTLYWSDNTPVLIEPTIAKEIIDRFPKKRINAATTDDALTTLLTEALE